MKLLQRERIVGRFAARRFLEVDVPLQLTGFCEMQCDDVHRKLECSQVGKIVVRAWITGLLGLPVFAMFYQGYM